MRLLVGDNVHKLGCWRGTGSGPDENFRRQNGQRLTSLLPLASVYRRPQTAAAPTLSSPCLMHRSENEEQMQLLKEKLKNVFRDVTTD